MRTPIESNRSLSSLAFFCLVSLDCFFYQHRLLDGEHVFIALSFIPFEFMFENDRDIMLMFGCVCLFMCLCVCESECAQRDANTLIRSWVSLKGIVTKNKNERKNGIIKKTRNSTNTLVKN